jgi:hypothetical protein
MGGSVRAFYYLVLLLKGETRVPEEILKNSEELFSHVNRAKL